MPRPIKQPRLSYRPWTSDEEKQLETLAERGATFAQIAQALGRSLPSVRNKVGALEAIVQRKGIDWYQALSRPHSNKELMARFGVTVWAVQRARGRLRKAGFKVFDSTKEKPDHEQDGKFAARKLRVKVPSADLPPQGLAKPRADPN